MEEPIRPVAVWLLSATTIGRPHVYKRPPYVELIVTGLVMAFLTLVVVGGFNSRTEDFGQISMRAR